MAILHSCGRNATSVLAPLIFGSAFFGYLSVESRAEEGDRFFQHAKGYADAMLEHAQDTYGDQRSSLLLSMLDRDRMAPFNSMPREPHGIRNSDRVSPYGANVNLDFNLYRLLYALSEVTGQPEYRETADKALQVFLKDTPSPVTHFFAWGEHLCWDLKSDSPGTNCRSDPSKGHEIIYIHEPKRPTVLSDKFYEFNETAMVKYAHALWEHQIGDHSNGNFSRHAYYDHHEPGLNFDFPKEGGYFLHDWARAYERTRDERFLNYINVLADRYLEKSRKTGDSLVAFDSQREYADTSASLSLAIDATHAAKLLPDGPDREKLLRLAAILDKGLLALPHDVSDKGFVMYVTTDGNRELYSHKENGGYSYLWSMKYGRKTTGMLGTLCFSRAAQLGDSEEGKVYRELAIQAADKYSNEAPDRAERPWPLEIGIVTNLELLAYQETGDPKYLQRAKQIADYGIDFYWTEGNPLPKADPEAAHYENITRADTLAYAMLAIHVIEKGLPVELGPLDIDR